MPKDELENGTRKAALAVISESTPIRLGLVFILVTFVLGAVGVLWSAAWWASSVSTKLDLLVKQNNETTAVVAKQHESDVAAMTRLESRIISLEMWQQRVEATGTTPMVKKVEEIEKELIALERKIELHTATGAKGTP